LTSERAGTGIRSKTTTSRRDQTRNFLERERDNLEPGPERDKVEKLLVEVAQNIVQLFRPGNLFLP
jgi:hypothetical protein